MTGGPTAVVLAWLCLQVSVCIETDIKCPLNLTLFNLPDGSQDCAVCRICPPDMIEEEPCGYRKDPVCRCKDGFYRDSLYNCWPCSPCPQGQYIKTPCSWTEDVVCENCTRCGDEGEVTPCGGTQDTICSKEEEKFQTFLIVGIVAVVVITIIVVVVVIICIIKRRRTSRKQSCDEHELKQLNVTQTENEAEEPEAVHVILEKVLEQRLKEEPTVDRPKKPANSLASSRYPSEDHLGFDDDVLGFHNSVGALVHEGKVITVFRVGPSYVMTAFSAVRGLIESKDGKLEVTFDEHPTSENRFKLLETPLFTDTVLDVVVLRIKTKPSKRFPEPVPLCKQRGKRLDFVLYDGDKTDASRFNSKHNELLVVDKATAAIEYIDGLLETVRNKGESKKLLDKSKEELQGRSVYVWERSTYKLSSPGAPGFTNNGDTVGVMCMFTHKWPYRNELIQRKLSANAEWYAGARMAAVYKNMSAKKKSLAKEIFQVGDDYQATCSCR